MSLFKPESDKIYAYVESKQMIDGFYSGFITLKAGFCSKREGPGTLIALNGQWRLEGLWEEDYFAGTGVKELSTG